MSDITFKSLFGRGRLVRLASDLLDNSENILESVYGGYVTEAAGIGTTIRKGVLIATDRRLLFYGKKLIGYQLEVFSYRHITSFSVNRKLFAGDTITFTAAGNQVEIRWVTGGDTEELGFAVRERMGA